MKKLFILPCILFCVIGCLYSQWIKQNFPNDGRLLSCSFVDEKSGWVLGNDYISKTENGGADWVIQDSVYTQWNIVYALNADTAFFTEHNHVRGIRKTIDGGLNWYTVDTSKYYYTEFDFINKQIGYLAGGDSNYNAIIRKTEDGGGSWVTVSSNFSPGTYEIEGISFLDEYTGWAVSYDSHIFHTIDGGQSWSLQDSIFRDLNVWVPSRDIHFISADSGWVVGGIGGIIKIARTTDGGKTWVESEVSGGASLTCVHFTNSNIGWIAGRTVQPWIYKTIDGGVTWQEQAVGGEINSLSIMNDKIAWAVGDGVYKTMTGGLSSINENTKSKFGLSIELEQNFPNPFNPKTTIRFKIMQSNHVSLKLFNLAGQEIAALVDQYLHPDTYDIVWDAADFASGVYLCKIQSGKYSQIRKLVLIK